MPYTVNGMEYDFDSSVNHRIKQDFVNREVMKRCCDECCGVFCVYPNAAVCPQ